MACSRACQELQIASSPGNLVGAKDCRAHSWSFPPAVSSQELMHSRRWQLCQSSTKELHDLNSGRINTCQIAHANQYVSSNNDRTCHETWTPIRETFTLDLQKTPWHQQLGLLHFLWTTALKFVAYLSLHVKAINVFLFNFGVHRFTYT